MSYGCGPTYGQFVAWLHAAGLLPITPTDLSLTVTSGTGNVAGAPLAVGTLVYVAGWDNVNNCPMVAPANATNLSTCATYIVSALVPAGLVAGAVGEVAKSATITGLALVAAIGDPAYLTTAGTGTVQAGTTGLTTADVCQQIVGYFVTAGTSVYVDLTAAAVQTVGTSELQNAAVTPAKADLTQKWTWTGSATQISLGQNGTLGAIDLHDGGTHKVTVQPATLASTRTYTLPDAGGNATFIMSQGTTNAIMTGTSPQLTLGNNASPGGLAIHDGTKLATLVAATLSGDRTYTLPDAGGNATFIMSQGTTAMTNTAASPQVTLGSNSVAAGLALGDGSSANKGTVKVTTLTAARTYTLPDYTGNVAVPAGNVISLSGPPPVGGYTNPNLSNVRFGDAAIAPSTSSITVTVTGVPNTAAASGSVVFVQFMGLGAAPGPVAWPGAFVLSATISGGVLTVSLLNASTGAALSMGAATALTFNYVILY